MFAAPSFKSMGCEVRRGGGRGRRRRKSAPSWRCCSASPCCRSGPAPLGSIPRRRPCCRPCARVPAIVDAGVRRAVGRHRRRAGRVRGLHRADRCAVRDRGRDPHLRASARHAAGQRGVSRRRRGRGEPDRHDGRVDAAHPPACSTPTASAQLKTHIVVFFILIVSNCGGLLTPARRSAALSRLPERRAVLVPAHAVAGLGARGGHAADAASYSGIGGSMRSETPRRAGARGARCASGLRVEGKANVLVALGIIAASAAACRTRGASCCSRR